MFTMAVVKITPYLLYSALYLPTTISFECPNIQCVYIYPLYSALKKSTEVKKK